MDAGNAGHYLGQAQQYDGVKTVIEIQISSKNGIQKHSQILLFVLSMFMLTFIFMIVCLLFEWKRIYDDILLFVYIWLALEIPFLEEI
jgi:hypothetical protein